MDMIGQDLRISLLPLFLLALPLLCAVPVASGIQKWRHEFEAHITGKRCPFRSAAAA